MLGEAYGLSKFSGRTEHVYGETLYAAQSWSHRRRAIIKAEVVRLPGRAPKCNPRFVVTNLPETPATVYALYCQRGDHGEPAQGVASWPGAGPHELFAILGQPIPRVAHGGVLRAAPGTAPPDAGDERCGRASLDAASAAVEAGGLGGTLGPPDRTAFVSDSSLGRDLATAGCGSGRHAGLNARPISCRTATQSDQRGDVCRESFLQRVSPCSGLLGASALRASSPVGLALDGQMERSALHNSLHAAFRHRL
ncbi:MAG: transposase [Nitrospira sp.]|nr:transposase [Nitrospira sp.]